MSKWQPTPSQYFYSAPFMSGSKAPRKIVSIKPKRRSSNKALQNAMATRETGYLDSGSLTINCDTTGGVVLLNQIPLGSSQTTRLSKKVDLKGVEFHGSLHSGSTGLLADGVVMLVYDKRPTGSTIAVTDVLTAISADAFNNDNNSGRFSILRRWNITCSGNFSTAASCNDTTIYPFDKYVDLKGRQTVYKSVGSGVIADQEQGALWIVYAGDQVAGTTAITGSITARLRFYDV